LKARMAAMWAGVSMVMGTRFTKEMFDQTNIVYLPYANK
jgi:hypothetical protein